jgi:1-acyl-sn-glycerol-3-phosphate acyltransferase
VLHQAESFGAKSAPSPPLTTIGRLLPLTWQDALRTRRPGLDLPSLLADLVLSHPRDAYGFDPVTTRRIFLLLEQTVCRYFRLQVMDAGNIPTGRAMIVGCHSGVFAWDATCLVVAIYRHTGRFSRNLGDRFFGHLGSLTRLLRATGLVVGEPGLVEDLLEHEELLLVFPGGALDMTRPIWRRYRLVAHRGLAPGRGGYIKIALRTASPIVPVAVVGTDEIHLMLGDIPFMARLLGTPFFPVVASPLPLPARIYVRFGKPIDLEAPPDAAEDQDTVDRLNARVQGELQALLDDTVRHRRGIYCSTYDASSHARSGVR